MSAGGRAEAPRDGGLDPALLAALGAAVLEVWPRPSPEAHGAADGTEEDAARRWRFSGRWWARQLPAGRSLPWVR